MKRVSYIVAVTLLLALSPTLVAEDVDFRRVALTLSEDGRILLDAEITFDLNETVSEALVNGVPLTFETHVQMRRAEAWATKKGCRQMWLETYAFQARQFYELHGFQVFGHLDGPPTMFPRYFLQKTLADEDNQAKSP